MSIEPILTDLCFVATASTEIQSTLGMPRGSGSTRQTLCMESSTPGADAYVAFLESLIKNPDNRVLTTSALKNTALSRIKAHRTLRLIDLCTSGGLVRIGVDSRLFSADRSVAQLWSKALHDHPACADGILYPSRLDPSRQSVALF